MEQNMIQKQLLFSFYFLLTLFCVSCSSEEKPEHKSIIGLDPKWSNLDLMGKEYNVYAFSDDFIMLVTQYEDIKLSIMHIQADNLLTELVERRLDAILSPLEPTAENRQLYDFSDPYLMLGHVLVIPSNVSISELGDIEGKVVAVPRQTSWLLAKDSFPRVTATHYDELSVALDLLELGKVDVVIAGILPAYTFCENLYKGILKVATPPLDSKSLRLVTRRGENKEFIEAFNHSLTEMKNKGTYDLLLRKWSLRQ
jgi:polar amino acid transport system substrate-binding protein